MEPGHRLMRRWLGLSCHRQLIRECAVSQHDQPGAAKTVEHAVFGAYWNSLALDNYYDLALGGCAPCVPGGLTSTDDESGRNYGEFEGADVVVNDAGVC